MYSWKMRIGRNFSWQSLTEYHRWFDGLAVKWKELQPLDPRKWRNLNLCSIIKNLAIVQENWIKSAMKLSRKFLLYSVLWICLNIFFEGLYVEASDPVGNCKSDFYRDNSNNNDNDNIDHITIDFLDCLLLITLYYLLFHKV